jgi:hypothetical protein
MKWANLLVCALGTALVFMTGCGTFEMGGTSALNTVQAIGSMRVVDGSPQTVAVSMAAMLKGRGFAAKTVVSGNDMVLETKTAAGLKFALVLHGIQGANGHDQTQVNLQWMDASQDSQVHVQIMSDLDKQPGAKK